MTRMDQLRNLLIMAAADGRLTEREIDYFMDRRAEWGIGDIALASAIEYALSPQASLALPPGHEARLELLEDMIRMMAADGRLADVEREMVAIASAKMEITQDELNGLLDRLTAGERDSHL